MGLIILLCKLEIEAIYLTLKTDPNHRLTTPLKYFKIIFNSRDILKGVEMK